MRLFTRRKRLDLKHLAVMAMRALTQRYAGQALVAVTIIQWCLRGGCHWGGHRQQFPTAFKVGFTIPVGEKPIVADALEA